MTVNSEINFDPVEVRRVLDISIHEAQAEFKKREIRHALFGLVALLLFLGPFSSNELGGLIGISIVSLLFFFIIIIIIISNRFKNRKTLRHYEKEVDEWIDLKSNVQSYRLMADNEKLTLIEDGYAYELKWQDVNHQIINEDHISMGTKQVPSLLLPRKLISDHDFEFIKECLLELNQKEY